MKTGNKILIYSVLVFGLIFFFERNAFAAQRIDNITTNVNLQVSETGNSGKFWQDHLYKKFGLDFVINQDVNSGDYFEIETHGLPPFKQADILSPQDKITPIGTLSMVDKIGGGRHKQDTISASSPEFADIRPEEGWRVKYKITFNENVEKLQDVKFSVALSNVGARHTISAVDYVVDQWVKVNDASVFSENITIFKYPKNKNLGVRVWHYRTDFNTINNTFLGGFGYSASQNLNGSTIEIEFPENSPVRFLKEQRAKSRTNGSNFIYTNNSTVNNYGVIKSAGAGRWTNDRTVVSGQKMVLDIKNQTVEEISSGFGAIDLEFTELGKKFIVENNGNMPEITYIMRIKTGDNTVFELTEKAKIVVVGQVEKFTADLRKEIEKPKVNENDPKESVELPKDGAIKTPNTGFYAENSLIGLTTVGVVLGVVTFGFRRMR